MIVLCAVAFLLWSNVYVHSRAVPNVTFMEKTLPNNSYANLSLVGGRNSDGEGVQCHTDLTTCCIYSGQQGNGSGNWYAPGSITGLPFEGHLSQRRDSQKVTLLLLTGA